MKQTTVSTAAASGGVVGALTVILTWALGVAHVNVPPEVAAAFMVVVTPIVHWGAMKLGVPVDATAPAAAPAQPAPPATPAT